MDGWMERALTYASTLALKSEIHIFLFGKMHYLKIEY